MQKLLRDGAKGMGPLDEVSSAFNDFGEYMRKRRPGGTDFKQLMRNEALASLGIPLRLPTMPQDNTPFTPVSEGDAEAETR